MLMIVRVEVFSQLYDFLTDSLSDDEYAVIRLLFEKHIVRSCTVNGSLLQNDLGLYLKLRCTKKW